MFNRLKVKKFYKQVGLIDKYVDVLNSFLAIIYAYDSVLSRKEEKVNEDEIDSLARTLYDEISLDTYKYVEGKMKTTKIFKEAFLDSLSSLENELSFYKKDIFEDKIKEEINKDPKKYILRVNAFLGKFYYFNQDLSGLIERYQRAVKRVNNQNNTK